MNETVFQVILSGILAVAVAIFISKSWRNKTDVFYTSTISLHIWSSVVFTFGIALVLAPFYTTSEYFERNIPIYVGLIIAWFILFLVLISNLSQRYVLKDTILTKKELASKDMHINVDKITSIEYIVPETDSGNYYQANMSDGGCDMIDDNLEDIDRLFCRLGQINNNIHFHFPIHHTGEGSFFDRFFNFGTIIATVVYAVGFYMLLGRIL